MYLPKTGCVLISQFILLTSRVVCMGHDACQGCLLKSAWVLGVSPTQDLLSQMLCALEKLVSVTSFFSSNFNASHFGEEKIPTFLPVCLLSFCSLCYSVQPALVAGGVWRALVALQLLGKRGWEVLQRNSPL